MVSNQYKMIRSNLANGVHAFQRLLGHFPRSPCLSPQASFRVYELPSQRQNRCAKAAISVIFCAERSKPTSEYQDNRRNSRTRLTLVIVVLISSAPAGAQELGNKVLGTLGLLAGSQPGSGLYVADRLLRYSSSELIDRNGHRIPVGLDLDAVANAVGSR